MALLIDGQAVEPSVRGSSVLFVAGAVPEAEQQLPYDDYRQEHLFRVPHLLGDEILTLP
jgi:hypothetical protein